MIFLVFLAFFHLQAASCPLPPPNRTCLDEIFRIYGQIFGISHEADEYFDSSLPDGIMPLSVPFMLSDSFIRFPIISNQEFCDSRFVTLVPKTLVSSMECSFQHGQCSCEVLGDSGYRFVAISPPSLQLNYIDQISRIWRARHLDDMSSAGRQSVNTTSHGEDFDIGVVTHGILVILSLISFAGNALFVVYVFWLSR